MDGTENTIPERTIGNPDPIEQAKIYYLRMSQLFCPELPANLSDLRKLEILQKRIAKARKLSLLLNRPWLENNHLIQRACDWYMVDQRVYYKERQRMIDVATDRNVFLERMVSLGVCMRRLENFFHRLSVELGRVIRSLEARK